MFYQEKLTNISDEEFQTQVDALVLQKEETIKNMSTQFSEYYSEIVTRQYNFDRGNIITKMN